MSKITIELTKDQARTVLFYLEPRIAQIEAVLSEDYTNRNLAYKGAKYVKEVHKERQDELAFMKRLIAKFKS